MTGSPFPDSRPLADLTGDSPAAWPAIPDGVTYRQVGEPFCYVMLIMPDKTLAEGTGISMEAADADARRNWLRWKRAHAGRLAVDGREYRRRARNRRRR
jgi:hypothetical protein